MTAAISSQSSGLAGLEASWAPVATHLIMVSRAAPNFVTPGGGDFSVVPSPLHADRAVRRVACLKLLSVCGSFFSFDCAGEFAICVFV